MAAKEHLSCKLKEGLGITISLKVDFKSPLTLKGPSRIRAHSLGMTYISVSSDRILAIFLQS